MDEIVCFLNNFTNTSFDHLCSNNILTLVSNLPGLELWLGEEKVQWSNELI